MHTVGAGQVSDLCWGDGWNCDGYEEGNYCECACHDGDAPDFRTRDEVEAFHRKGVRLSND